MYQSIFSVHQTREFTNDLFGGYVNRFTCLGTSTDDLSDGDDGANQSITGNNQ